MGHAGSLWGLQLATWGTADDARGLQIGAWSNAKESRGVQLGLLGASFDDRWGLGVAPVNLGTGSMTGSQKPTLSWSVVPCNTAPHPTPTTSSFFVYPSVTPRIMLAMSARVRPQ